MSESRRRGLSQSTRRAVLERDGYKCQECDDPVGGKHNPHVETAHVHHKEPVSEGGSNKPENLVTLCKGCHKKQHRTQTETGKYRAIMTTTDRERISGESGDPDKKVYESVSRVRARIDELENDVGILEEHHPDLLEELRNAVCEDSE